MNGGRVRAARVSASIALILLVVGPLVARTALAEPRPYVTVYGAQSDPIVLRLVPELVALGCVVRTDAPPAADPTMFAQADGIVRVTDTNVTFWLLDPQTGRAHVEETVAIDDRGPEGIKLTSVRVSEIVRARLLRVAPTAAASRATVNAAPRAAAAVSVPPQAHLSAGLGVLVLLAPGGTKPASDLSLSPEWHLSRRLQLRALLAAPLTAPNVVGTGGQAAISTWLGGAAIDWQARSNDDMWRGTLGAGAAAVLSQARGTASTSYAASTTDAVAAMPFVEMGGSQGLGTPRVRLGARGMLGVAIPEIVVKFAGQTVATWGAPVVGAVSVTLDVDAW